MKLLHFHFYHPLNSKEGIIYLQALRHKMIISKDHILQEKHYNLTYILLTHAYPLHLMIKNIKTLIYTCNNLLPQLAPHTDTNVLPIITPFSFIGRSFTATIHKIWHTIAHNAMISTIWPPKHSSAYAKSSSIHNHLVHSAQTYGS